MLLFHCSTSVRYCTPTIHAWYVDVSAVHGTSHSQVRARRTFTSMFCQDSLSSQQLTRGSQWNSRQLSRAQSWRQGRACIRQLQGHRDGLWFNGGGGTLLYRTAVSSLRDGLGVLAWYSIYYCPDRLIFVHSGFESFKHIFTWISGIRTSMVIGLRSTSTT